jgi:hypothetical protein
MVFWHLFVPLLRPAELTRYTVALTPFFATGSQGVSSTTSYILEDYHRVEAYAISLTCHNSLSARSHHDQSARQRGALGSYPPPPRQLIRPAEVVRRRICLPVTTMPFATFVLPAAWHFVINWEKRQCTPPDSPTGGSWHDESKLTGCLMSQATVTLLAGKRARPPAARTLRIPPVMLRQPESVDML